MRRGSISSELIMCGGGVRSMLLLRLVARCLETIDPLWSTSQHFRHSGRVCPQIQGCQRGVDASGVEETCVWCV